MLEAPHGARFDTFPVLKIARGGHGGATFTVRLGREVDLGRDTILEVLAGGSNLLEMGDQASLLRGVRLILRCGSIRMARAAQWGDGAMVKSSGELTVGVHGGAGGYAQIHCTERITLGDFVSLAERVSILDSDHLPDGSDRWHRDAPLRTAPVDVGRNVLVLANAVVLPGTRIGANALVATGSVLNGGDFPAAHVIAGVPGRAVRSLADRARQTSS